MLYAWMPLSMRRALASILRWARLSAMSFLRRGLSGTKPVFPMAVNRLSLS